MAQTIALQRGTATVTSNMSSATTLFTQSGGTATRVIVNQLIFSSSSEWSNSILNNKGLAIYHTSSGGLTSLLGLFILQQGSLKEGQFPIAANSANLWEGQSPASLAYDSTTVPAIYTSAAQGISGSTSFPPAYPEWTSGPSYKKYAIIPSQFYIGPGDSLSFKAQGRDGSSQPTTITLSYSFTTITES